MPHVRCSVHGHIPARIDHRVRAAAEVGAEWSDPGTAACSAFATAHTMAPPAHSHAMLASAHPLVVVVSFVAQLPSHYMVVDLAQLDRGVRRRRAEVGAIVVLREVVAIGTVV